MKYFDLTLCKSLKCNFKLEFFQRDKVVSVKRLYDKLCIANNCIRPPAIPFLNCHSLNLGYSISCDSDYIQFAENTIQPLNETLD